MYMSDLSAYKFHHCDGLPNVLPVGWLSAQQPFAKGTVAGTLLAKLSSLAVTKSINFMRGIHRCEFCNTEEIFAERNGAMKMLGSAEVWIPGDGVLYASPNLIVHYIASHGYRPPTEYLDALEKLDIQAWAPPRDYVRTNRQKGA